MDKCKAVQSCGRSASIGRTLKCQREVTAGNLAEYFDMTKPTVSHHFSILKNADLVSIRKDGQTVWYRVRIAWRDTPQTTALSRPPP